MNTALRRILGPLLVIAMMGLAAPALAADAKVSIEGKYATVNGLKMHYLVAGKGEPVILLHGYAQNSHMWRPLMKELAKTHLVIAPDLRGFGDTTKAGVRLRQEDDGAGRACAGAVARHPEGGRGRTRHRPDGRLRVRRAVSRRGRSHRAAGRLHSGRGRHHQPLPAEGPVALPLLRHDAARARRRAASASTSSTSGTTSPPTARNPSPRPTAGSTRRSTRSPAR